MLLLAGRAVAALAVLALLPGCAHGTEGERAVTEPAPCSPGQGRPISEATLKAVLAQHGVQLRRDDRCDTFRNPKTQGLDPRAPLATLRNSVAADDSDGAASVQGDIFCQVERRNTFGPKLERLEYEGDEETHLRTLNVLCTIYPETPEQIDALAAALSQLPGVRD